MKEKQEVKTIDLVLSLTVVMVMVVVVGTILNEKLKNPIVSAARSKAEKLSHQLLSGGLSQLNDDVQRRPSSLKSFHLESINKIGEEGQIAKDPWGNPYQFKFIKGKNREFKYLAVWSMGPNERFESDFPKTKADPYSFEGDDVGILSRIDH